MKVQVLLFARLREITGAGHVEVEVEEGTTPASIFEQLSAAHPQLAPTRARLRVAIDQEYAEWETPLRDGAELAFIPPTAGG
jgi:molybdopterin converting factor subunit 1